MVIKTLETIKHLEELEKEILKLKKANLGLPKKNNFS
jgi:hypothetical protein